MPIKSKSQWREMAANQPKLFHKWQKEYPVNYDNLPEHAKQASFNSGFMDEMETSATTIKRQHLEFLNGPSARGIDKILRPTKYKQQRAKDLINDYFINSLKVKGLKTVAAHPGTVKSMMFAKQKAADEVAHARKMVGGAGAAGLTAAALARMSSKITKQTNTVRRIQPGAAAALVGGVGAAGAAGYTYQKRKN